MSRHHPHDYNAARRGASFRAKHWLVLVVLLVAGRLTVFAASNEENWSNLKDVAHDRTYEFLFRDSTCLRGTIASVDSDSASVRLSKDDARRLSRQELLRIMDVPAFVYPAVVIYTGRSSWMDIMTFASKHPELITVTTASSKEYKGKFAGVSASDITVDVMG